MVIETMLAKNRENRYTTPDDLILDLKCLHPGRKPDDRRSEAGKASKVLAHGDADTDVPRSTALDKAQMIELAGIVNNRNQIIATVAMILALSVITNLILFDNSLNTDRANATSTVDVSSC